MNEPVASHFNVAQLAPVARPDAPSALTVAPAALPIVLRKGDVVSANTPELRSLIVARDAHAIFDRQTGCHGNSSRRPLARFFESVGPKFLTVTGLGAVASVAAALGAAIFTDGLAWPIALYAGGSSAGAFVTGLAAALAIDSIDNAKAQSRPIPGKALEPLRALFDAPAGAPLDRAVIAKLAASYAADLDTRKARGEASRAVLRDVIKHGEAIDADTQQTAAGIVDCFAVIHDERGELLKSMQPYEAQQLENVIANLPAADIDKVCAMVIAVLFIDDVARPKMAYDNESRLYRVLTGIEKPVYDAEKAKKPEPRSEY